MGETLNLKSLSDDDLLRGLSDVLRQFRRDEVDLIAYIGEVDERRLYAREASPSMFAWCMEVLHLSEAETALRIGAARAARKHPMLLTMLGDGRLHLSGLGKLAPHLTRENRDALLKRATHKSKREIEEIVAELKPRPDASPVMRRLPARREPPAPDSGQRPDAVAASPALAPARSGVVEPLAPTRYKVCFTASVELRDKLERLQALMRSSVRDGDLARIIEVAVTRELERIEAKRFAKTKAPRKGLNETDTTPKSRYIPAAVRRVVHERDGGQCTYRDKHGRRCSKRHDLEFHHRKPFGRGGHHGPEVLCLLCKTHNVLMAEHDYGEAVMARYRRSGSRVSESAAVYGAESPSASLG